MSAYVVADDCINSIVTWLTFPRHEWERRQVEEALAQQGSIGDTFEQKLGNAMFELNCNAVEQRYGDGQAKEFRDLDYAWKANYHASGYGVYDKLGEYLYQCSEGDVPEASALYKALDRVYNDLAHVFFRELRDRKVVEDEDVRKELRQRIEVLAQYVNKSRRTRKDSDGADSHPA